MARPFTFGLNAADVGKRAKSGKCHLCFLPDSRWGDNQNPSTMIALTRTVRPEKIVGQVLWNAGTFDAGSYVFSTPSQGAETAWTVASLEVSTDNGPTITSPLRVVKSGFRYTGTNAAAPTQFANSDNRVASFGMPDDATIYVNGNWWEGKTVTARQFIYGENTASTPTGLYTQILRNSVYTLGSTITNLNGAAGLRYYDVTSPQTTGAPNSNIIITQAITNPTSASFSMMPPRYFTGEVGMQLDVFHQAGGYSSKTWADAMDANPALFAAYWAATDCTDVVITTGINDATLQTTKALYKVQLLRLIANIKTALPTATIWLMSAYPTSTSNVLMGEFADAMYEYALTDPATVFIDLNAYFGDKFVFINQFLSDGVHPNEKGTYRAAAGFWAGVESLAASVTNPNALLDYPDGIETGYTLRQTLRLMSAAMLGKSSNGNKTFRSLTDSKNRITATVDGSNNRTTITYDAT